MFDMCKLFLLVYSQLNIFSIYFCILQKINEFKRKQYTQITYFKILLLIFFAQYYYKGLYLFIYCKGNVFAAQQWLIIFMYPLILCRINKKIFCIL